MQQEPLAQFLTQQYTHDEHYVSFSALGNGHINETFLLQTPQQALVVQKLNNQVFKAPQHVVQNARLIEQHLHKKQQQGEYDLTILRHIATLSGAYLSQYQGQTWRALALVKNSYSKDIVNDKHDSFIAANAFAQFSAALHDFDAQQLAPVIPDFHNLAMRIAAFKHTLQCDVHQRAALCQAEITFCQSQFYLLQQLDEIMPSLPVRTCHNDTKINNMLFCKASQKAAAVIDLDTCMPGYLLYDFGDMVRTFCSAEAEDSPHLEKVIVREDIFSALVTGYLQPIKQYLTDSEKHSLWLGAKLMTFMVGLRFLTDYLDGDNYFAVAHSEHNLQRAKNQFALYQNILAKQDRLKAILDAV